MAISPKPGHAASRRRTLDVETLETRALPSATLPFTPSFPEQGPNDTADVAQPLGDLSFAGTIEARGNITVPADVDWFTFTLDRPAEVMLGADAAAHHDATTAGFVGLADA